jgi:parallel beta-helix repeat protein
MRGGVLAVAAASALLLAGSASAVTGVRCGSTIKSPGSYQLTGDCSGAGITIKASHVSLDLHRHTMTGGGPYLAGIYAQDVSDLRITGPGTIKGYGDGILLLGVHSSYIGDLTTKKNDSWGILLIEGSSGDTIENVTAANNGKSGIQFSDSTSTGNLVTHSTLIGNPNAGVAFFGAADNRVEDSIFSGNFEGIFIFDDGNEAAGNTVNGSVDVGILVAFGANDNAITGNSVHGSGSIDLVDGNASCDSNTWSGNSYGSRSQTCIN